ncbi:MAG: hypothetical protein JWQ73_4081 [Variovorax sp.]|nr:hypothetical protein [Variovorax sp.]
MRKFQVAVAAVTIALCVAAWFHRPATAGEWAAWVQAFGVLAAIFWGVRLQRIATQQSLRQAGQVASMFAQNMHWVFRELNDACAKQAWADYSVHRRILEEILAQGREVTLQMLEGRSLAMVSSLRTIAVEALEITQLHVQGGNWRELQFYFDKRLPSIAAWLSATGNPPENSGPTDYAGLRTSYGQLGNP